MEIDLLNSEGALIKAKHINEEVILFFHGTTQTRSISKSDLIRFIYGEHVIESPTGEKFRYSDFPPDMKPFKVELNSFLNSIGKNMEIERKWLLYKLPDLPENVIEKAKHKSIVQIYNSKGRFRSESWVEPDGEAKTVYTHAIKKTVSAGVMEENEKTISEMDFVLAFTENDGFVKKQRVEWEDGEVKWFIDSIEIHGTLLLEAEIPSMEYHIKIPDYLKESIFAEVTGDERFHNRTLRIKA